MPVGGIGCAYHGSIVIGLSRARPKFFRVSDTQDEIDLWTDARGIHGTTRTYECPRETGKLLERAAF